MLRWKKYALVIMVFALLGTNVMAQQMTLEEAIATARERSAEAVAARSNFVSSYWSYRTYLADRLPSLNLYGNVGQFNRTLAQLQDYDTGDLHYVSVYNLTNDVGLYIRQNVTFTGGTVSLYSSLSRTDLYGNNRSTSWYSQPVYVSYTQPLFSYNEFRWAKKISPKEYEQAKRVYIESMESITINAAQYFFSLLLAQREYDRSVANYNNTKQMLSVAEERTKLGTVTRDEYLQLELRNLNDSMAINEAAVAVKEAQMVLNSLLGFDEKREIKPVFENALPEIWMDYDMVLDKALENSSFNLENQIRILNAESEIAQAKARRSPSVSISAKFGASNSGDSFSNAYRNLADQEVFGVSFNVPIFDWGLGTGRVKRAEARADAIKAQVQQSESDYKSRIFKNVSQFNNQRQQCNVSKKASEIAEERYSLMMEKFRNGNASVLELNTAQNEYDTAMDKYVTDFSTFWRLYFTLRQLTLYDFIGGKDIDVDHDELLK
ncbi:MAG: TolC family protein [Bacteroidales bacterium]|nr:TolC family protein [Bacteroidales bacterium]